jgi:AraC family transcriptional regulator
VSSPLKPANLDYVDRVNRAVDYVTRNLDQALQLQEVARAACFSSYHFHRIFRALMGETLASFVKRVRLERSLYLLSHRNGASLTEIALACGFGSSSDFSRSFRGQYGVAPSRFDIKRFRASGRKALEVASTPPDGRHKLKRLPVGKNPDGFAVNLRKLPARRVAYIRVNRPYEGTKVVQAVKRLLAWAEARGLADGQWLGYQWEDPEIVPLEKCRYDVGVVAPGPLANAFGTVPSGKVCVRTTPDALRTAHATTNREVSFTEFAPMLVAEIDIKGTIEVELRALDWLYRTWLPSSGYAPAHQPGFEAWNGRPFAHGMEYFEIRIQLPVVPAHVPL